MVIQQLSGYLVLQADAPVLGANLGEASVGRFRMGQRLSSLLPQAVIPQAREVVFTTMATAEAFTVIGGGDSIAAARRFGLLDRFSYVCTAGGGLVRFLAGDPLVAVNALRQAAAAGQRKTAAGQRKAAAGQQKEAQR